VVAQTGHDAKSGGWVTAGIAAIVVGVIAVAGWFLLFKSRNGNDGQE
jgi:LPXTG-motif cell wall anchor domain protein